MRNSDLLFKISRQGPELTPFDSKKVNLFYNLTSQFLLPLLEKVTGNCLDRKSIFSSFINLSQNCHSRNLDIIWPMYSSSHGNASVSKSRICLSCGKVVAKQNLIFITG